MDKFKAIVLAGGSGSRMHSAIPKQYLPLCGRPLLYYSLKAFDESGVDGIVLVTGAGEDEYCRTEIIEKYGIKKVEAIVFGGRERYDSVYAGLKAAEGADYVLIHDGARPFVDDGIIRRSMDAVHEHGACVVGMPVKDTIKVLDEGNFAVETPERARLWQMQTPQSFSYRLILSAYAEVLSRGAAGLTDDAMVLELATGRRVKVIEGSYRNIKVTTPEDLETAEAWMGGKSFDKTG